LDIRIRLQTDYPAGYPTSKPDGDHLWYPAGYPILILSMLTSDIYINSVEPRTSFMPVGWIRKTCILVLRDGEKRLLLALRLPPWRLIVFCG